MAGRLLLRLGQAMVAAWGIASLVFVLSRLALGSPEQLALAQSADYSSLPPGAGSAASLQAARQSFRHRLGLDEPVFYVTRAGSDPGSWQWHGARNQYHRWCQGLLHGQLGVSYRDGQPVATLLEAALAYTLPLTLLAMGLVIGAGRGLALALAGGSSVGAGSWRAGVRLLLLGLQALPLFALALGLLLLLANPDFINILPTYSLPLPGESRQWGAATMQLLLPVLALVLAALPEITLTLEAALRYEGQSDYATTARAKGLPTARLLRRHLLPNALLPTLTALADLLPTLLAGTVVVETLFAVPGVGRLLAEAAAAHDYPVMVGGVLLTAVARLLALLLADVLALAVDPRIRRAL